MKSLNQFNNQRKFLTYFLAIFLFFVAGCGGSDSEEVPNQNPPNITYVDYTVQNNKITISLLMEIEKIGMVFLQ